MNTGTNSLITFSNSKDRLALLALLVLLDGLFLMIYAPTLAVSESEARLFFAGTGWLAELIRLSASFLGQDNFGVRFPFVFFHLINLILLYYVALGVVKKPEDALLAVLIFALLPGVNSAAVLISSAGIVITFLLIFILLMISGWYRLALAWLFVGALFDGAFLLLAMATVFYGWHRKDWLLMGASVLAFGLCFGLHGFDTRGYPRGYFLDVFGLYGAVFSPLVFMFFIYTLYWYLVRSPRPLPVLWFLAFVPFVFSILLSIRQNLPMDDFGPYAVIATPLMAVAFMNSWRIRLPGFRRTHGWLFGVVFVSLIIILTLSVFHKPLYALFPTPRKHFAYEHHFVDELAAKLNALGVTRVKSSSDNLQLRLRFYGIYEGGPYALSQVPPQESEALPIEFMAAGRTVAAYYLWVPAAK